MNASSFCRHLGTASGRIAGLLHNVASVVLADGNETSVRAAAGELIARGYKALAVRCDVSDDQQVEATVHQSIATFGRLDAVYNNAGIQNILADTADTTAEDYDRVMGVNLRGVWS